MGSSPISQSTRRSPMNGRKPLCASRHQAWIRRLREHDQLMSGCHQALARLWREYETIVVVTSRPPSLREATLQWFSRWCPGYEHSACIFKDREESVLQTATWKARLVAHFARQHETLLFIDDDERNRNAVAALAADLPNVTISVRSCFEEWVRDADFS